MRSPSSTFDLRAALCEEVNEAIAALDRDAKAVHACRVKLKRARALARIGHVFAPGMAAVFNDTAREIMHELAIARNLAALSKAARKLAKRSKKRAKASLRCLSQALTEQRKAAGPPDLAAVETGLRDLLALAQVWPEASALQVRRGARYVARRARRAWRKGRDADASVEKRHEWRQREKDRLYVSSILGEAWPRRHRRARNERLVDLLGREHDLMLLTQRVENSPEFTGGGDNAEAAIEALQARRRQLLKRARRVAERLHSCRA